MQKIFTVLLVIIFATLVLLFAYKTVSPREIVTASANNVTTEKTTSSNNSPYNKEDLHEVIKDYIINNPDIIIKSLEGLQRKKIEESTKQASEYLKENKNIIEETGTPPTFGNEQGDITIVVFYDYNCSFCKKANEQTNLLLKSDTNTKLILRPIPILGGSSMYAAKISLAVHKISQEKFPIIHEELMKMSVITEEAVKKLLQQYEIDYAMVENEVNSYSTKELIAKNFELAKSLGITGTPSYVINGIFIPGLVDAEKFSTIIAQLRNEHAAKLTKENLEKKE